MIHDIHNNQIVQATLIIIFLPSAGLFIARIIHAIIIAIKHTIRIIDVIILIKDDTIMGNVFVYFSSVQFSKRTPLPIQFPIIGKFVFNFIHTHFVVDSTSGWAYTCEFNPITEIHKIKPNMYTNIFFIYNRKRLKILLIV